MTTKRISICDSMESPRSASSFSFLNESHDEEIHRNSRKLNAFTWWNRLGRPNKKTMRKRLLRADMHHIDLTPDDIELLPWIADGFTVDMTPMISYMSKVEIMSSDRKNRNKKSKNSTGARNSRKSKNRMSASSISKSSLSVLSELESLPFEKTETSCGGSPLREEEDDMTCDTSICSFSTFSSFMDSMSSSAGSEDILWGSFTDISEFDDLYELDMELNSGGFGTVHKTYRKTNPWEVYAVKVFERTGNEDDDKNIIEEAEILRELEDIPSVTNLIDFHISDDRIYMVQELARGGDIFERIVQHGSYDEASARCIVRTLLETVHTMHTRFNLVHRDIKPENVLLRNVVCKTDVVLCDFGSARYLPNQEQRGLLTTCGTTPAYSSPEIIQRIEYREEVDIWSIGCIMFVLLGGYSPFEGNNDAETGFYVATGDYGDCKDDDIWDDITDDAKDVIRQMLTVDRNRRCTSSQALQHEWFCTGDQNDEKTQLSYCTNTAGARGVTHATNVPNFEYNTANKLSTISMTEKRRNRNYLDTLFTEHSRHDFYGDCTETEFTDTCEHSYGHDDPFVMGITANSQKDEGLQRISGGVSCSVNNLRGIEEHDEYENENENENAIDGNIGAIEKKETSEYYSIEQLQSMSVPGLDYKNRERYLCNEDFETIFGATRREVAGWRPWRINHKKKEAQLW